MDSLGPFFSRPRVYALVLFLPFRLGILGVWRPETPAGLFKIDESSISRLLELIEGLLDPGDCNGDSLAGIESFSEAIEAGETTCFFSSPVIASEIALNPVALVRENIFLGGAGRSNDEVSLPATLGDVAMASMLGESPYSSFVTVGDTEECFKCACGPLDARPDL
jgi:hypothetical protein